MDSVEFLLRLLEEADPIIVTREDFDGARGEALKTWQGAGFLSRTPGAHPCPSCPHCGEGDPYPLGGWVVCNRCRSRIDPGHLLAWQLHQERFLSWLASGLNLKGDVRPIDRHLWHLGTGAADGGTVACFYTPGGTLSDFGRARLDAFREVLLLHGLAGPPGGVPAGVRCLPLVRLLREEGASLALGDLREHLRSGDRVRFDPTTGGLWAGEVCLGEVPVGSKEFHFLHALARQQDRFVPYADLKAFVLRQSGSTDSTEEATFCQGLKSRTKKKIPQIDRVLVTTNKGDGYRLRAHAGPHLRGPTTSVTQRCFAAASRRGVQFFRPDTPSP